jgi:hypothetical protein
MSPFGDCRERPAIGFAEDMMRRADGNQMQSRAFFPESQFARRKIMDKFAA